MIGDVIEMHMPIIVPHVALAHGNACRRGHNKCAELARIV